MKKLIILSSLILAQVLSSGVGIVDYSKSGANWNGTCWTGKSQSPIEIPQDQKLIE